MKKRLICVLLLTALLFTALAPAVHGQAPETDSINSNSYIRSKGASLSSNGIVGQLRLKYGVSADHVMTLLGVYQITVRYANGSIYQTIWGSTSNGLQVTNATSHSGSIVLKLPSGSSYYCTVRFIAKDANGTEYATVTTPTVACP